MKIERLSKNQIRCTLNKADLADKDLLITELAYGTEKAKELFREMMQQASTELGFEVDNIPLMIEAIPVSPECLILIVTKVEDAEELDTRFSRFTKPPITSENDENEEHVDSPLGEGIIEALGNLAEELSVLNKKRGNKAIADTESENKVSNTETGTVNPSFKVYAFDKLEDIIVSAGLVKEIYSSENTLYKNIPENTYYLYMKKDKNSESEFSQVCNIISEYGNRVRTTYAMPSHMEEHYKLMIYGDAIQVLSKI